MRDANRKAMFAKQNKPKYVLLNAHHPTAFEKDIYAVSFRKKNEPLIDKNTELFQVRAKNKKDAIKKGKLELIKKIR